MELDRGSGSESVDVVTCTMRGSLFRADRLDCGGEFRDSFVGREVVVVIELR